MKQGIRTYKINAIVVAITLCLLLLSVIACDTPANGYIYTFFNNQSVSVTLGALGIYLGYYIWKRQKRIDLLLQHYQEFLEQALYEIECFHSIFYLHKCVRNSNSDVEFISMKKAQSKQDASLFLIESLGEVTLSKLLKEYQQIHRKVMYSIIAKKEDILDKFVEIEKQLTKSTILYKSRLLFITRNYSWLIGKNLTIEKIETELLNQKQQLDEEIERLVSTQE